jgi:quercetin dioxygenase-like cupin family protein
VRGPRKNLHAVRIRTTVAILCAALAGCRIDHPAARNGDSKDRTVLSHALPRMNGDRLGVTVVEVTYGPGESSPPHRHPCPVIGYVVEGTLRMRIKGEPEIIYRAGESFYEAPDRVHLISANGSDREPARFLAYFTCDQETPLSVAEPEGDAGRGRER